MLGALAWGVLCAEGCNSYSYDTATVQEVTVRSVSRRSAKRLAEINII